MMTFKNFYSLFVHTHFFFLFLWKAVLRNCGLHWVTSFIFYMWCVALSLDEVLLVGFGFKARSILLRSV